MVVANSAIASPSPPFIVVISMIGAYSPNNSMFDVFLTIVFGFVGYWLRKMKYPLAPLVVAIVLGDSTERELRKALIGSGGDVSVLVGSPIAATLMLVAVPKLAYPVLGRFARRARHQTAAGG